MPLWGLAFRGTKTIFLLGLRSRPRKGAAEHYAHRPSHGNPVANKKGRGNTRRKGLNLRSFFRHNHFQCEKVTKQPVTNRELTNAGRWGKFHLTLLQPKDRPRLTPRDHVLQRPKRHERRILGDDRDYRFGPIHFFTAVVVVKIFMVAERVLIASSWCYKVAQGTRSRAIANPDS